jgi:hypothetical protein
MPVLNCPLNYIPSIPLALKNAIFAWQIIKKVITWLNFLVIQNINSIEDVLENGLKSTMLALCAERVLENAAKPKA